MMRFITLWLMLTSMVFSFEKMEKLVIEGTVSSI